MQFLVLSHPNPDADPGALAPLVPAEAGQAWRLHVDGTIRQAYFRTDQPGAVLIAEAPSAEALQVVLDDMPLRRADLITFEVVPIGAFTPWATLFSEQ